MPEQEAGLVIRRVVRDVLHRVETKLIVKALDEGVEGGLSVLSNQEDVSDLRYLCESSHMVIDQWVAGHYKQKHTFA